MTGSKQELIQRLLSITQPQPTHEHSVSGDNTVIEDPDNSIGTNTNDMPIHHSLSQLPQPLMEAFVRYTTSSTDDYEAASSVPISSTPLAKLLPIQQQSYPIISQGRDTVLFSPTGTGKLFVFTLVTKYKVVTFHCFSRQ